MPSSLNHWVYLMLPHALRLLGILVIALAVNRLLRAASKLIIKTATAQTRQSQLRERSEEHTSELQSRLHLVCRLLLEKKKSLVRYLQMLVGNEQGAEEMDQQT